MVYETLDAGAAAASRAAPFDNLRSMGNSVEERVLRSLRRISRAVDLHSRRLASTHRLTTPQLLSLRHIRAEGSTTPSRLARAISLSQATVTGILDRLEGRGLIGRSRNPSDKRQVLVELTEAGREAVDAAPLPLHERFAERLAKLPEAEQRDIEEVLERIVSMMEAEDIDAAPILVAGPMDPPPGD